MWFVFCCMIHVCWLFLNKLILVFARQHELYFEFLFPGSHLSFSAGYDLD